jgi:hypothetical protein
MNENTLTFIPTSDISNTNGLTYANGEQAWLHETRIGSIVDNSTAIQYWSYDIETKKLTVQYRSSDTYYYYEEVPYTVIFEMMFADSLGAFIAKTIKPTYSVA